MAPAPGHGGSQGSLPRITPRDGGGGRLSIVLLLTDAPEPAAEILPSLSLLAHDVRTAPASATAANGGSGSDAILVDARRDLVQVRRLLRLLHGAEMTVPVLAVVTEGGWAAVTADWGADDVILHTAARGVERDPLGRPGDRRTHVFRALARPCPRPNVQGIRIA